MGHCSTASGWDNILPFHGSHLIYMWDYTPKEEFKRYASSVSIQPGLYVPHRDRLAVPNWNQKFQRQSGVIKYSSEWCRCQPSHFKTFFPLLICLIFCCSALLPTFVIQILRDTSFTSLQASFHHPKMPTSVVKSACDLRAPLASLRY